MEVQCIYFLNRRIICQEFGIKLAHSMFSSDYSNNNAERVGFKTDAEIKYYSILKIFFSSNFMLFSSRYEDIVKFHPEFDVSRVKSKAMTIKTLVC